MKPRGIMRWLSSLAMAVALVAGAAVSPAASSAAVASNVTVNFGKVIGSVSRDQFGLDISGYGPTYITDDATEDAMLKGRYGVMRMGLMYKTPGDPSSPIVANGAGASQTITGDQWVSAIKKLGATPVVIVPADATDAVNMVRHFNAGTDPNRVSEWIVGNETDNSGGSDPMSATAYADTFNTIYDAMKKVDPTITIGGPATAFPDFSYIQTFLDISGSRTDFIDFHEYGEGGGTLLCDSTLLADTTQWQRSVGQIRAMIKDTPQSKARASQIPIQVGEYNTDWSTDPDPASTAHCDAGTAPVQYRNVATVIDASVFLHLVQAGATGMTFADHNGALGAVYDLPNASRPGYAQNGAPQDGPMPAYLGEGFFTGIHGTTLSHFGTKLVQSATTLGGVEVVASSSADVIVLINKSPKKQSAVVGVGSGLAKVAGYQKGSSGASYALPAALRLKVTGGQVALTLPAWSVTQLVLS
jgi:hypothetical protein